jgi:hypothetical protein
MYTSFFLGRKHCDTYYGLSSLHGSAMRLDYIFELAML